MTTINKIISTDSVPCFCYRAGTFSINPYSSHSDFISKYRCFKYFDPTFIFYSRKMSCTPEKNESQEPNEPAVIESLKSLDMNAKDSAQLSNNVKDTGDDKGKNH